jgi:hypothetical protein
MRRFYASYDAATPLMLYAPQLRPCRFAPHADAMTRRLFH